MCRAQPRRRARVGTLGFVAPEQIRGERVDARTDVDALVCALVDVLTGGAYMRDSDEATPWAYFNEPPPLDRVPRSSRGSSSARGQ